MAQERKEKTDQEREQRQFRRQAALALLTAYVSRHGGFQPESRDAILSQVWDTAEAFVAAEDTPCTPPLVEVPTRPAGRRVHPNDEWAVRVGDEVRRGFALRDEAEEYAVSRGGEVVQVGGPEIEVLVGSGQ